MADVRLFHDSGTVTGFLPVSPEASAWVTDNVASEPWQWLGAVLWVDTRMAVHLVDGMCAAGFTFEEG